MTEEEVKKMIDAMKKDFAQQIDGLKHQLEEFMLHSHNGGDSSRIDFSNIKGSYNLYKDQRPIL